MGTLPNISVIKGNSRAYNVKKLYHIFENVTNEVADDAVAMIYEDENNNTQIKKEITYKELNIYSNRLAREIVQTVNERKIQSNTDGDYIVAVSMLPTDRLIVTLLAIWKSGCAYLPLDPTFPKPRIQHILQESSPALFICEDIVDIENDDSIFDSILTVKYQDIFNKSKYRLASNLATCEQLHHERDDLAIVLYTSGSTGIPKGVRLTHPVILNRLQWQWHQFPYSPSEYYGIFKTALTFVDSVSEIWGPLLNGLTIIVVPKHITKDPVKLVDVLEKYKIERLVLVPSLLRSLILYMNLERSINPLKSLKIWVCSGEPLPVQLAEEFFKYFKGNRTLCNFYGSTEIMGDVTYYAINDPVELHGYDKVPIGVPIDNTITYLLDEDMKPVTVGNIGELYVSGLNLAAGYVNGRDPDKFLENSLVVDPSHCRLYKTGDYARIDKGQIVYEGRTDSQIKVRGQRVDLSEVEKAVAAVPGVDKAVVLCYKPGEMDQAVVAFVTVNDSSEILTGAEVERYLGKMLTSYMIPQVIILDNIPLLVNGKIDRQTLLKLYANRNSTVDTKNQLNIDFDGVPENKLNAAKVLFETVASVIGHSTRTTLSLKSNFYQLGGNSLNSIYTVTKLWDQGFVVGITDFLKAENLEEILYKMKQDSNCGKNGVKVEHEFVFEMLADKHRETVIDMIAGSFYEKADLEQWLKPEITLDDYVELIGKAWNSLVEKQLSFIAFDKNAEAVGVSLNFDARDEPEFDISSKLSIVFEFLEYLEAPIRDNQLPPGKGALLHSLMMGTKANLTPQENVIVIQALEEEVLRIATEKGFKGIFTTNTSPLTQQLGIDIYGYKVLLDYQVNQYVAKDNSKPFAQAPDSQRSIVCWKEVQY